MFDSIPTTAVERYLGRCCHGDGMVFDVIVLLEGQIDTKRFAKAWQESVRKNPQVFFRLQGRGKNQVWKRTAFDPDRFKVDETPFGEASVRDGVGACVSVIGPSVLEMHQVDTITSDTFGLKFSFHHAACDGVGAARLIYQTMQRYRDDKPRLDSENQAKAEIAVETKLGKTQFPELANFWATICGHNARLDRHAIDLSHGEPKADTAELTEKRTAQQSGSSFFELGADRSDQIRSRLRANRITVNDFCVSAVLQALAGIVVPAKRRYISIMNPVQMRSWEQRRSTRNHIGFAFVRRRHDQLTSFSDTLDSVSGQMKHVRDHGIASELAQGIEIAERIPGGLACIDRLGWFVPTASVTCLSSVKFGKRTGASPKTQVLSQNSPSQPIQRAQTYRVGEATVKGLRILGPLQARGQLSITMWDTGSGLSLSMRGAESLRESSRIDGLESVVARKIEQVVDKFLSEWSRC